MDRTYYTSPKRKHRLLRMFLRPLRNKRILVTLIVLLPILLFVTFSSKGIIRRLKLEGEKRRWQEKIREAQLEEKRLQEEIKALENDLGMIEKIARERYGMVREGETVYRVTPEK
jgi:cell division protein FtsB